jgi:hypothetical protein
VISASADAEQVVAATFLLPGSSAQPLVIELPHHALRLVVVNNGSVSLLDESWGAGGIYVLLGAGEQREHYSAYVGKAPSGLRARVGQHVRSKEGWDRALLVAHTSYGFSSSAVGWLEGRLWDVLRAAPAAELRNQVRPRDETLPPWDRRELERYIAPITAVLRALGANPDTPDQVQPRRAGRGPRRSYAETIANLIDAGMLTVGARLHPLPEAFDAPATVLEAGQLEVDGSAFDTPSAAAVHVVGHPINGWDFWGVASGDGTVVALSTLRQRLRSSGLKNGAADDELEDSASPAPNRSEPIPAQGLTPPATAPPTVDKATMTGDQLRSQPGRRQPHRIHGTLADLEAAGLLNGQTVFATYKGERYEAMRDGENGLRLPDGTTFRSLSLAAVHLTGRPTNGWTFWKAEHLGKTVPLATLRATLAAPTPGTGAIA